VPGADRVAVIANPTNVSYQDYVAANESAARQLGFRMQMIPVSRRRRARRPPSKR
jgi:hypothetical protein